MRPPRQAAAWTDPDRSSRDRATMARALAYLLMAGATISLATILLPHEGSADAHRVVTQAAAGFALAALVGIAGERLPTWSFQVFLALATLLIEWNIYASGDATSPYAAFYFWVAIYAFYFFTRREAIVQTTFIVVAYAALLVHTSGRTDTAVLHWVITMSALVVGGALIGVLQDRVTSLALAVRTDPVTGLLNRRGLHETLDAEVDRARRSRSTLAVVVARVDGYRSAGTNADTLDTLIAELAQIAVAAKRTMDHAARAESNEITLLAPDCDEHGAYLLAERIRSDARRAVAEAGGHVSVSLGVAAFPTHAATSDSVMHAASQGVQAAEHLGRDRTVIYNAEIASIVLAAETRRTCDRGDNLSAVLALTEVLDIRDAGTATHSQTVGRYAEWIARGFGLSDELVERIRLAGILHDVGKIAVPDGVLNKPGPLTDEEYDQMKRHPEVGALIVDGADLKDVASWVQAHHERPDGRGYPFGLEGDEIPLEARILAVADAYEAMTVDRVYRRAMPASEARTELRRCAGTQFDPRVVEVFLEALDRRDAGYALDEIVGTPSRADLTLP